VFPEAKDRIFSNLSPDTIQVLACSFCASPLQITDTAFDCLHCGSNYAFTTRGSLDLRLRRKKKYPLEFELQTPLLSDGFEFAPLKKNEKPEVDFSGVRIPNHLSLEIMSHFPRAKSHRSLMLDLGCGRSVHRTVAEHAGFQWIGVDYNESKAPPIVGDAHSLPFATESMEFVMSIAMMEHIRFPFVAMKEIYRVLKTGGKFLGTVAFLEPFHGNSFYHHSALGIYNSLQFAGFSIHQIAPNENWPALKAQASMALFPHVPRMISQAIVFPAQKIHELCWSIASRQKEKFSKNRRMMTAAGAFTFIVSKER
jgi:ubiquinone/menaquinone biosynthesis C-methylase UbiE